MDIVVYDNIGISEIFGDGNIFSFESLIINENVTITKYEDFSSFLRGYPYVEITRSNTESIDLGGGYEQIIDFWGGKTKKEFEITFPVMTKTEVDPILLFYNRNYKSIFYFTDPLDSVRYFVKFSENNFKRNRDHYNTYTGSIKLVEVL
jgi:phage-related protein